ncbi:MAG: phosphotransferase, partial [Maribacter sp.]
ALRTSENKKLETAKNAIHFARKTLVQLKEIDFAQIPLRICHNDTKLNNILFSKISGKALCLIDLDTLMKGYFFYDFGDAVRTIANTAPEDERDNNKITFNKSLFSAFIKGLADNGLFLLKEELDSLCFGAVFMPFIHGLRALTDYLNNDRYYKTTYENQNLDRCSSLFNFTQKALDNVPFMEKTIQEYFPSNG